MVPFGFWVKGCTMETQQELHGNVPNFPRTDAEADAGSASQKDLIQPIARWTATSEGTDWEGFFQHRSLKANTNTTFM